MVCLESVFSNFFVIANYLRTDLLKKQRAFRIGLISIFLVVFFLTMLLYSIFLFPAVFIRVCEEQVGESDYIFLPMLNKQDMSYKKYDNFDKFIINKTSKNFDIFSIKMLDFDDLNSRLKNLSFLKGISPRWMLQGNATKFPSKNNNNSIWSLTNLIILNSDLENKIGMGRKLKLPKLNLNECYVSNSLFKSLKSENKMKDNKILIDVKLSALLSVLYNTDIAATIESYYPKYKEEESPYYYDPKKDNLNSAENHNDKTNSDEEFLTEVNIRNLLIKIMKQAGLNHVQLTGEMIKDFLNYIFNYFDEEKNFEFSAEILKDERLEKIPYLSNIINGILNEQFPYNLIFKYNKEKNLIEIKLKELKDIIIKYNLFDLLGFSTEMDLTNLLYLFEENILDEIFSFQLNLTVKEKVKNDEGKWPSASGNVLAIDSRFFNEYLEYNLIRIFDLIEKQIPFPSIINGIKDYCVDYIKNNFNINKYALTVNGILQDKYEVYKLSQIDMRIYMSEISEKIIKNLGEDYPIQITTPIYTVMANVEIAKVFLDNIFLAIMAFLWLLSVLLIYSLMLGNVDERTFEFGMLRALGFKKNNLVLMIIIQGFIFAIPGVFLGLVSAYVCNHFIAFLFNIYSGICTPFFMNDKLLLFGFGIGISIPLISSYLPIKKCLDSNLKESLSIFNKKSIDLIVSMVKLENLGISPSALIVSIILIVMGFCTYYVAPLSFLLMNPSLFVFIMIIILLTMLMGMIILIQLIIPKIEKIILFIIIKIFMRKDNNIYFIVSKNLEGHAKRNQKVSIMFMIALGFIIFSGCTLNLIVKFIQTLSKSAMGGDVMIWYYASQTDSINEIVFDNYLKKTIEKYPNLISNYTFMTFTFTYLTGVETCYSALNGWPTALREIYAVDKNYLYASYSDLYQVTDYDENMNYTQIDNKVDLVSMLDNNPNTEKILNFPEKNNIEEEDDGLIIKEDYMNFPRNIEHEKKSLNNKQFNVFVAEGLRKSYGLSKNNPGMIEIPKLNQKIPTKIVGMSSKIPGSVTFSSYNTIAALSSVYMSINEMKELIELESEKYPDIKEHMNRTNVYNKTYDGLRKQGLFLMFKKNAPQSLKDMVYYEMKNLLENDGAYTQILDDIIKTSNKIKGVMEYIFLVLGLIALILSFFLIWSSFYSNIKENIGEYGILRAIGISIEKSTRIYLYEAASIIISSVIGGTFIGVVISCTLILQFNMFAELPFEFDFPYKLYIILTFFGMSMGLLGSYYPTYEVNSISLIKIMKGFTE